MSRFLFSVWPFAGHISPCLSVATALRERGHHVGFYTGEALRSLIEDNGFSFFPFDRVAMNLESVIPRSHAEPTSDLYQRISNHYSGVGEGGIARVQRVRALFDEVIAGTLDDQFKDIKSIIERWHPSALVTDAMMWAPVTLVRERLGVPVAVFSFYAGCLIPGRRMPPLGLGLPYGREPWWRAINACAAIVTKRLGKSTKMQIDCVRASHGLPPLPSSVMQYSGDMDLYLVASVPQLDYDRADLPASVRYVGPCLWDGSPQASTPAWLAALSSEPPVIYISEGTAQVREPLLIRAAIAGLADLPLQLIVTTGPNRTVHLGPLPANVRLERWVPHRELFGKTSVVITNGGSGTVREALQAGIPLLVSPMEWDQIENAQRVADFGAGIRLNRRSCTPENIRRSVLALLEDGRYRFRAEALRNIFDQHGGERDAAMLIERIGRKQQAMPTEPSEEAVEDRMR